MIFEPELRVEVPTTDIVSYIFSNPDYDHDEPMYTDVHNPSRSISYNQAHSIIRKLVAGLRAWGVKPGDCVAIHSFNDIYYSMLVLAIVGAGGVYTGTNPAYTTPELAHHFKASQTRFVLSEPELLGPLKAAMKDAQIPDTSLRIFNTQPDQKVPAGERSWKDLFNAGEQDWVRFDDLKRSSETTAARLFSSGTTGLPKAVAITHRNLIAQHHLVFEQNPRPDPVSRVVAIPVFHAAAAPSTHFGSLRAGHRIFMMRRFDLGLYLSTNEKYKITDATVVPPIVIAILMTPASHTRPWLKSIKAAAVGAAPLDKDAQAKFRALIGDDAPCTQVWGMTETCCIGTKFSYPEHDDTGSVGRLIPNLQAKLVDDDGNNISAWGVRGELCVRGPTVTPGYFNNPKANEESFDKDGWFHTGDIAYCDEATRKWYIVDRKKELIKVRGFQVAPPELEAALLAHPQIIDAAVIGLTGVLPDSELPRAYVVRRPGTGDNLTEKDVQTYMGQRLAKYKALTGGVKFVPAIPKNASGKILKRVLREESQKEIKAGKGPKL